MPNKDLIKYEGGLVKKVDNAMNIASKLLTLAGLQLIPYRKKDKWGFCTTEKVVSIECSYEWAWLFSEEFATVKKDSKIGFINEMGNVIVPFIYESADDFSNGIAKVEDFRRGW
jgi:hypothetical protein